MVASKLFNAVPKEVVQRAGELIITVLTGTRHKGALEAAAASLADFCSKLLTNVTYEVGVSIRRYRTQAIYKVASDFAHLTCQWYK